MAGGFNLIDDFSPITRSDGSDSVLELASYDGDPENETYVAITRLRRPRYPGDLGYAWLFMGGFLQVEGRLWQNAFWNYNPGQVWKFRIRGRLHSVNIELFSGAGAPVGSQHIITHAPWAHTWGGLFEDPPPFMRVTVYS